MDTVIPGPDTPHILRPPGRDPHVYLGKDWQAPYLSPSASTRELGTWGEEIAARHLSARGLRIFSRNWRCRLGEIDIVCFDPRREAIVACEVKTRRDRSGVPAIESVSRAKLARLRQLLALWLSVHGESAAHLEIDVIAITSGGDQLWNLCHIEGVA